MSNFGMQMPGGRQVRAAGPDVYTALMFVAVLSLGTALGVVYWAGSLIGPDGSAFGVHEAGRVELPD